MSKKKIALLSTLAVMVLFTAYCLYNPRWFHHTFMPRKLRCGTVTGLFVEGGTGYVAMMDKELKRSIIHPVSMTRFVNFRVGDYHCESLSEWEVNKY